MAQATGASNAHPYEGAGELAAALDELMVCQILTFMFQGSHRLEKYLNMQVCFEKSLKIKCA